MNKSIEELEAENAFLKKERDAARAEVARLREVFRESNKQVLMAPSLADALDCALAARAALEKP